MPALKTAAPIDRRVARTRKTLHHALLQLMLEKGYDAVTVEDICRKADVGRSTFYAHFTDKDDLKRSGLDHHLRAALLTKQKEAKKAGRASFAFALPFFEHAHEHLDLYRALVSKGGAPTTIAMMRQIITDLMRRETADLAPRKDASPREATVQFLVGAFMSLLTWWLDNGAKLAPDEMDSLFRRLASEGVA
jgi:AcrR family transcriptional regulator